MTGAYRSSRGSILIGAVAAALLGGCASDGSVAQPSVGPAADVMVFVENNNWQDIRVYAVRGGAYHRLGTVMSMTRERFRIPPVLQGQATVQLAAFPIGGPDRRVTERILIGPGSQVHWRLENALAISSYTVR